MQKHACPTVQVLLASKHKLGAGLNGSSLHVWYKALFQELLQQWSSHANSVVALHKTRQGPLQQEGADAALSQLKQGGKAFASLLTLNKIHLKRIQVCILIRFAFFSALGELPASVS